MIDDLPRTWVADLFGEPSSPRAGGRGRRRHVPTVALQARVKALRDAGLSIKGIAHATKLSPSTLFRHYAAEVGSRSRGCLDLVEPQGATGLERLPRGRPRHEPTADLAALVRQLALEGRSLAAIARAVRIAPQTLRRHYAAELGGAGGGGAIARGSGP